MSGTREQSLSSRSVHEHIGDIGSRRKNRVKELPRCLECPSEGSRISRTIEPNQGDGPKSQKTRFGHVKARCSSRAGRFYANYTTSEIPIALCQGRMGRSRRLPSSKFRSPSRRITRGSRDWIARFQPADRCRRPI